MNSLRRLQLFALLAFGSALASQVHSAVLVNDSRLVSASAALASATKSGTFPVDAADQFRLTVTDTQFPSPSTVTGASAVVVKDGIVMATIGIDGPGQTNTKDFSGDPGTYSVHAFAKATGGAEVRVSVSHIGASEVYANTVTLPSSLAAPTNGLHLETSIKINGPGAYSLTVTDRNFPAALNTFDLILVDSSHTPVGTICFPAANCNGTVTTTFTFNASAAGDYQLIADATAADPAQAGLVSIAVTGPVAVSNGAGTYAVGKMPSPALVSFPADGNYTLRIADLAFPAALTAVRAELVQADSVLVADAPVGDATITNALTGNAQLYTLASASGTATYSRQVLQGSQVIYGDVRTNAAASFVFATQHAALGTYTAQLKDFGFPAPLTGLQAVISQSGTMKTTMTAPGSTDLQLSAGSVEVLAIPQAAANTNSLFGVSISTKTATPTKVLEATQGIGQLFDARTFTVTDAGSYDVSLADLKFPAAFSELAVAVTRGPTLIGQIFGGGKFSFNATRGDYTLSFIAKAGGTPAEYGLYATKVATTPPAPVVTLTASPTSVAAQGTTTLTWSSSNADSCTASGAWSGSKPTGGSGSSPAITADSTFTLTCSGPGGSNSASTTVTIAAKSGGGGGGGSVSLELMALLAGVLVAARRKRFSLQH